VSEGFIGERLGRKALARLPLGFGLLVALSAITLFNLQLIFRALAIGYPVSDYRFPEVAVRIAFERGWSHLYDTALPNPPPMAWLVAPFALLPSAVGYALFAILMLGCLVASSQVLSNSGWSSRLRALTLVLALLPAMAIVIFAQVAAVVILAVSLCWALLRSGREVEAGVILAAAAVKPHLLLIVPFSLLLAGYRRSFVSWVVASAVLVALSLLNVGPVALVHYATQLLNFDTGKRGAYSLTLFLGYGAPTLAARAVVLGLALLIGWLSRGRSLTAPIAAGVAGSLLISGYLNAFDLALYSAVLLMLLREGEHWLLPTVVLVILWITLETAISSGILVVLLEVVFLLSLIVPLLIASRAEQRGRQSVSTKVLQQT